jgi:4-hydroxy-tetrahydrodipicolinate synthase
MLVEEALGGNFPLARKIHYSLLELIGALFTEGNPAGVKAIMNMDKLIQNVVRLPLTPVSEKHFQKLAEIVKKTR